MSRKQVIIVGGGITGLSAAYYLRSDFDVTVLEESNRLGGKIQTEHQDPFIIESGPDCFFARRAGAMDLICELGLEQDLIEPQKREFGMLIDGQVHKVPAGLISLTFCDPNAVRQATFLSDSSKQEVLNENSAPKGNGQDETIQSFFSRRFGAEFSRYIAEPLLAGTHSGRPEKLSMKALYPNYIDLEQKNGCLTSDTPPENSGKPTFVSLKSGMVQLVESLQKALPSNSLKTGCAVEKIDKQGNEFQVHTNQGIFTSDIVLVTSPSYKAKQVTKQLSENLESLLDSIRFASSAIVTHCFSKEDLENELDGTGFLVPFTEEIAITGSTWTSSKWPNRAPEGQALIRAFMGRDGGYDVTVRTDEELKADSLQTLQPILGLRKPPAFSKVHRWHQALPQYELGHVERVKEIESEVGKIPGLYLAGASYHGVGVPTCILKARAVTEEIKNNHQ